MRSHSLLLAAASFVILAFPLLASNKDEDGFLSGLKGGFLLKKVETSVSLVRLDPDDFLPSASKTTLDFHDFFKIPGNLEKYYFHLANRLKYVDQRAVFELGVKWDEINPYLKLLRTCSRFKNILLKI